jgi:fatty-acyl-CoA synthase
VQPYAILRDEALDLAKRLHGLGLKRGARMALIAETSPDFVRFFFACQYAGLTPVPLPVSVNLGNRAAYINQTRGLLEVCDASIAMAPSGSLAFLQEAAKGLNLAFCGDPDAYAELPVTPRPLPKPDPQQLAYLQFTSGSTRFPRGVMITQATVMANLEGIIKHGVNVRPSDRCCSWLPFYHDMGLVGLVLAPLASQISVDYIDTRNFAMRPRQWLTLMSHNRATISFGPSFGYELAARRLRPGEAERLDLSAWRVAGVGAEMIRPGVLETFTRRLMPSGFNPKAFLACYGMAECSLAVSFASLDRGIQVDWIDGEHHSLRQEALPATAIHSANDQRIAGYVNCGTPLPGHILEVRAPDGQVLPDRHCGAIFVKGPSVMSGYLGNPEATRVALTPDGWLNTGDIGYQVDGDIYLTGRQKDLIIINGRNVWPQDLEHIAEQQPELRPGDALAFSAPGSDGAETTVLVVQCRESDPRVRQALTHRLRGLIHEELSVDCHIELVPPHTLPRTSSGKLSRSRAQLDFIQAREATATVSLPLKRAG